MTSEHNHEHHEGHEDHSHNHLHDDTVFAARFNRATGVVKTVVGLAFAHLPLVTEGVHDFGDDDIYRDEAKAIHETDPSKKVRLYKRAALKLGGYSLAGFGLEAAVDAIVHRPTIPVVGVITGAGSLLANLIIHRRLSGHTHEDASASQEHAHSDIKVSVATIGSSLLAMAGVPYALVAGSLYHLFVFGKASIKNYQKAIALENRLESPAPDS